MTHVNHGVVAILVTMAMPVASDVPAHQLTKVQSAW
jgi:hypothetical protein